MRVSTRKFTEFYLIAMSAVYLLTAILIVAQRLPIHFGS